jgi:hypothetical protein
MAFAGRSPHSCLIAAVTTLFHACTRPRRPTHFVSSVHATDLGSRLFASNSWLEGGHDAGVTASSGGCMELEYCDIVRPGHSIIFHLNFVFVHCSLEGAVSYLQAVMKHSNK